MLRNKIIFLLITSLTIFGGLQAQEYETESCCSEEYGYGYGYDNDCGCDCDDCCCCYMLCWRPPGRPCDCDPDSQHAWDCGRHGTWFCEDPVLFRPFAADPRQLTYSAAWRFNDNAMTKNVIPVSFYDVFTFYRWFNVWPYCGQLQIDLEGGLWACFDPCTESAPLLNADYYGGLSASYAICQWSFKMRLYHISSHIGDEYLLNHPRFRRRNPSAETLDFFASYDLNEQIRYYAGAAFVLEHDESFTPGRYGVEGGCEIRFRGLGFTQCSTHLVGHPYLAMHFRYWNNYDKHLDQTYVLGYEFAKCTGLYRKLRFFIEYHDGYSCEGQFSKQPTTYFSICTSYGY